MSPPEYSASLAKSEPPSIEPAKSVGVSIPLISIMVSMSSADAVTNARLPTTAIPEPASSCVPLVIAETIKGAAGLDTSTVVK